MATLAFRFFNPTTKATYRLILTGDAWRITKSVEVPDDDSVRLAHLRGTHGSHAASQDCITAVVRGESARCGSADPLATCVAVVLTDLACTADMLTALAREAQDAYDDGMPGFRPRSAALRERRDQAFATVVRECGVMAEAWRTSGLATEQELPEWLSAALADR